MNPDFVFIVSYECPRCHAALEARVGEVPSWLRCPECGRASLPPEHTRSSASFEPEMVIGTFTNGPAALPIQPRGMAPLPIAPAPKAQTSRVVVGSLFFLSTFLTIFSMIESNAARSSVFGLSSAVLLFFLSRPVNPTRR